MSDESSSTTPPKKTTSGIAVQGSGLQDIAITGTVSLSRRSMGMNERNLSGPPPPPEKTAPPPPTDIAKMPISVATESEVGCPQCQEKFDISPDFYNTVTECPNCKQLFVIRPPSTSIAKTAPPRSGNPPRPGGVTSPHGSAPAPSRPSPTMPGNKKTTSGIQVDANAQEYGVTGTVLLSRQGMGMTQKKRGEKNKPEQPSNALPPPPPDTVVAGMIYSVATQNDVGCPRCNGRFEISTEYYGMVAECPECNLEFVIKPPGTPPFRGEIPPSSAKSMTPPALEISNDQGTQINPSVDPNTEEIVQPKKNHVLVIGILTVAILLVILIIVIATK